MKGFENDDLFSLITVEEAEERFVKTVMPRYCKTHRLIDEIAISCVRKTDAKALREALDNGAIACKDAWIMSISYECNVVMLDAGYGHGYVTFASRLCDFLNSRDSARLAAILTMRAIRQKGSIYRDPARMVGRAIWASRAYYLEESEESGAQKKK